MPIHSYSPYWLYNSTKQQYVVILSELTVVISLSFSVSVSQFKYNVCPLVCLLVSNQIMYATATKCTMNVRPAVIHSKNKCSKSNYTGMDQRTNTLTVSEYGRRRNKSRYFYHA